MRKELLSSIFGGCVYHRLALSHWIVLPHQCPRQKFVGRVYFDSDLMFYSSMFITNV